ncbi:angiomotin [Trichonephila inaurata madagascariensis]|uniref:Angiomotin n=1 Tax=Trichonephila inaurata madagascariensis TaxID=2747483 RepID=A0A8X6YKS5_9ARAC|nr:angiomotin [Trichonephila inaurata madagascariensis]
MKSARSHLVPRSSSPKCTFVQSGYHQNLSGSDTDVSTSTENLNIEEKKFLQIGVRQEPQGEETIADDADTISSNTLIIHDKITGEHISPFYSKIYNQVKSIDKSGMELDVEKYKRLYSDNENVHHITPRSSPPIPLSPKSSRRPMYAGLLKTPVHNQWEQYSSANDYSNKNQVSSYSNGPCYYMSPTNPCHQEGYSVQGVTEIPKDYLNQSEILKYLAKDLNHPGVLTEISNYRPAPDYSKPEHRQITSNVRRRGYGVLNSRSKSADRLSVSRSHPDLSRTKHFHSEDNSAKLSSGQLRPEMHGRAIFGVHPETISHQAHQTIDFLSAENAALKADLEIFNKKISKLQMLELELQKVHKAYEDLVHSSEKRERLEQSIRTRLEMEIRRLQEHNKELREHLESMSSHFPKAPFSDITDSELRKELSKREVLISQLLTQTKELLAEKDRQEIELQAQRATLHEQRNHIDILDNALTNAQANVVRLEEECRKKQVYVDRVAQLQKALTNLQQSSEKRLQVEKKLRAQHEKEIQALRSQQQGRSPIVSKNESAESVESLKKTIMEYEEKIIGLEAEVSKWEQRYIAESTMRQIAVDAASVPKDAKIAALEKTSQESEKLIAQARTEKLKHMDELYAANRKCTELESRIKDFESKLAEKDAMIKVLQQHSQDKDTVFQNCVLGRPPRHTRAASTVGLTTSTCHTTTTTGVSSLGRVSPSPTNTLHRRTGSASGSLLSISSESSSTALPSQSSPVTESVTAAKKSLDEQLKELDSRLSSKDSIISALRAEKERHPSHFWRV